MCMQGQWVDIGRYKQIIPDKLASHSAQWTNKFQHEGKAEGKAGMSSLPVHHTSLSEFRITLVSDAPDWNRLVYRLC